MNVVEYIDILFARERQNLKDTQSQLRRVSLVASDRTAYQFPSYAYDDLPSDLIESENAWVTNGRKDGEEAGEGTGVIAFYNPTTNTWLKLSTETEVET